MIVGICTYCTEHNVPIRRCIERYHNVELLTRITKRMLRKYLEEVYGDDQGCYRCKGIPAFFFTSCPCGCIFSLRVCSRHRDQVLCPEECCPTRHKIAGLSGPVDIDAGSYQSVARRYLEDPREE